jgi:hypothetical protein
MFNVRSTLLQANGKLALKDNVPLLSTEGEERSVFWDVSISVIISKKVYRVITKEMTEIKHVLLSHWCNIRRYNLYTHMNHL